jgi:predicted phosphodiesterase
MSRYGVIADVHGNAEALAAALQALERHGVDRVIALGDLVGYNGESNECIELVRAHGIESVAGNHDLIALGRLDTGRCAMKPAFTLRRTRTQLTRASRLFLAALPALRTYEDDRIALMHGTLDDPAEYLTSAAQGAENARLLHDRAPRARVCFFGHTHVPAVFDSDGIQVVARAAEGTVAVPAHDQLTFVNPGSVDAARRREKVAELAIYDAAAAEVTFLRVPYDHAKVETSAAVKGFRMNRREEAFYTATRFLRRLPARARRLARRGLAVALPRSSALTNAGRDG